MAVNASGLGLRINAARVRTGWTQRQLAAASGISQPTISRLEAGRGRQATIPELIGIAASLGTTLGDLTGASPVRDRLVYAARTDDDTVAEGMKEQLAFILEMDAYLDDLGYVTPT